MVDSVRRRNGIRCVTWDVWMVIHEWCPPEWWDLREAPDLRGRRTAKGHRCDSQRVPSRDHEEETQPMALSQSALVRTARGHPRRRQRRCRARCPDPHPPGAHRARGRPGHRRRPLRADRHRTTHRNGSRTRLFSTKAGDIELHIPKLREGSFFPALLEPRRRIDRALWAVVMEAYVHGVSTRKVRPGDRPGHRCRDQQERGEPHLRRARRGRDRLPGAAARPPPLPVRLPRRHGAPRGAIRPSGMERPTAGLSQQPGEAGGSLNPETRARAGAAPTTTGRVGTARRSGSGKQDGTVQVGLNQWWNPLKRRTPARNLADLGRAAAVRSSK